MAWTYYTFAGAMLPRYNAVSDLSTPTVAGSIVPSLGGLYDYVSGATRTMTAVHQMEVTGILAGAGFGDVFDPGLLATQDLRLIVTQPSQGSEPIMVITTDTQSEAEYNTLKALLGVRGNLVIRDMTTGVTKSRVARLLRVRRIQEHKHGTVLIECSCLFETLTADWT